MMPLFGLLAKSRREADFPVGVLQKGLAVDVSAATASMASDKDRILNSIRLRQARTSQLLEAPAAQHPSYDHVNAALASHFSLASWFGCFVQGRDTSNLLRALRADSSRRVVELSMTGCTGFRDVDLQALLRHLPQGLRVLRLDLAFTGLETPFDTDAEPLVLPQNLNQLALRFAGSRTLRSTAQLPRMLWPLQLERLLSCCPGI